MELLAVMSIIVILIGIMVPALNRVKRYAFTVKQNVQISDSTGVLRSSRSDSYILISAGWDGEYGTRDDIANFPQ